MKRKREEEVEVTYKGVRPVRSGKFGAVISDPNGPHGRIWLGTFNSAIEAAKAFDKAALKIRGRNALLNFPLPSGISPEESTKTETSKTSVCRSRKRTKDEHDHSRPSSSLFQQGSRQSPSSPVGSSENADAERFFWTDENLVVMCDILNKHLAKNGRDSPFIWEDHMLEFQKISHHKFNTLSSFRRKYSDMKRNYLLWKSLTESENGLRWDKRTGKLHCSSDWWVKKIKENPNYTMIRKKQPSKELQEAWDLLFGNAVTNEVDCVEGSAGEKPSNHIKEDDDVNVDDDDDDDDDENDDDDDENGVGSASEHKLDSSQFGNLEPEEATPFSNEAGQEDISTPNQNATQERASKMLKTSSVNQVDHSKISAAISVINSMVDDGLMVSCSELWCYAVTLCEDDVKRGVFLSLPDNVGRLAWLQYKQNVDQ